MNTTLSERFGRAEKKLSEVESLLLQNKHRVAQKSYEAFTQLLAARSHLFTWQQELEHREVALALLDQLDSAVDEQGYVTVLNQKQRFIDFRQLCLNGYLGTSWSICDSFCATFGRFLCPAEFGKNNVAPVQLVRSFLRKEGKDCWTKSLPGVLSSSLSTAFGWPVAISYEIRNTFAHEGGRVDGRALLRGDHRHEPFGLDPEAWGNLVKKVEPLQPDSYLNNETWPEDPTADLRAVLKATEREMDATLGILLNSSLYLLEGHLLGFLNR